ncbi:putative papain-like cysteine peptidase superfamily [Helianthus anomalus]
MVVDTAAYMFMVKNGVLNSDGDYPYTAKDGVCDKSKVSSFFLKFRRLVTNIYSNQIIFSILQVEKTYSINGYAHIEPNNET